MPKFVPKFFDRKNYNWMDYGVKLSTKPVSVPVQRGNKSNLRLQIASVMQSLKNDDKIDTLEDALDFVIGDNDDLTGQLSKHEVAVDFMADLRKTRDERVKKSKEPPAPKVDIPPILAPIEPPKV